MHCFAIPAILEQRKRNKMAYHTILLRKFFFVYSVFMIIEKEPFRILLHVYKKHVPSKLHIQNRNHADTCRSTDSSASGQALDRLVAVSSIHCCTSTSALSTSSSSRGFTSLRMGYLILRGASRLDAFSVYPFRAWLLGRRLGSLTDAPAARPSRSSRTKDSSSQISYAHAG